MNIYESFGTVDDHGRVQVTGIPFANGTQVQISITALANTGQAKPDTNGAALAAARARIQELCRTVKGFRMAPKISREELYDRRSLS